MTGRRSIAACLLVTAVCASSALATLDVVRTYDENIIQTNRVDVSATPLTVAQMTSDVATAFDASRGGVIDFDNGSFDPQTINARFAGGGKSLRLTNTARTWRVGVLGADSSSGAISGPNVIFNGAPNPFPNPFLNTVVFGDVTDPISGDILPERVASFGFTIIDAGFNNAGNNVHIDVWFSDASATSIDYFIPLGFNTRDTFFGWTAPDGAYITQISFTATNNTASDDWAFITTPVPEPTAGPAVTGMGLIGMLLFRFRQRGNSAWRESRPEM
jgi:hypothetical protein